MPKVSENSAVLFASKVQNGKEEVGVESYFHAILKDDLKNERVVLFDLMFINHRINATAHDENTDSITVTALFIEQHELVLGITSTF